MPPYTAPEKIIANMAVIYNCNHDHDYSQPQFSTPSIKITERKANVSPVTIEIDGVCGPEALEIKLEGDKLHRKLYLNSDQAHILLRELQRIVTGKYM